MKIAVFSAKPYDIAHFNANNSNSYNFLFQFYKDKLSVNTVHLAKGCDSVCVFTNDYVDSSVIELLHKLNVKSIVLRCAGFNNVDIEKAQELGIKVARVPVYSPESIAEYTLALLMTLNRKTHKSYNRIQKNDFSLNGLMGFNIKSKTIGVVGLGNIGIAFCRIMQGFGCKILAYDIVQPKEAKDMGVTFVSFDNLVKSSDIISIHCPLNNHTHHLFNDEIIQKGKNGFILLNTSRGSIIDTTAVIKHLKTGKIGGLAVDVYENEKELFFEDLSNNIIHDDLFIRLKAFPNVIISGHQAFFTHEAMDEIVKTTLYNISKIGNKERSENELW